MTQKYKITLLPEGKTYSISEGTLAIDILTDLSFYIDTPCGGRGSCEKCGIEAIGRFRDRFTGIIHENFHPSEVLTCRSEIFGDCTFTLKTPEEQLPEKSIEFNPDEKIGIAVDIGTTTIQISITSLENGSISRRRPVLNPQRRYGHDILSRISAVIQNPALADSLSALTLNAIISEIKKISTSAGIGPDNITRVVFSGNTAMLYLLLGIDVSPLGAYPYTITHRDFSRLDINLQNVVAQNSGISAIPPASAFLGGDLVAGLALCEKEGLQKNTFFIDIGTNGELFVTGRDGYTAASSCAMGPALEGMNISSGMTASEGAVNAADVVNDTLETSVIGDVEPAGLCGTGLIDLIAVSLEYGLIDKTGAIRKTKELSVPFPSGLGSDIEKKIIYIKNNIIISQKDIRNFQLAKGASLAAARTLLNRCSINPDEIQNVAIAGSLGENLNLDKFKSLSFLPDFPNARWITSGNTSIKGAETACIDPGFLTKCIQLSKSVRNIDLASDPGFNEEFIKSLDFQRG